MRREEEERQRLEKEAMALKAKTQAEEKIKDYRASLEEGTQKLEQMRATLSKRLDLRGRNLDPDRSDDRSLSKLDSSVKRNTALNKKLKQISDENKATMLQDVAKVNQTKYVSEAAAAIGEVNFKQKDVAAVAEVCSLLHERYGEFTQNLLPSLEKLMHSTENVTVTKKRNTFRLILELFLVGVHSNIELLHTIVSKLVKEVLGEGNAQNALALLATFAKHSKEDILGTSPTYPALGLEPEEKDYDLAGTSPEEVKLAKETFASEMEATQLQRKEHTILKPNQQKHFYEIVQEAYNAGVELLFQQCKDLRKLEADNQKAINVKGELSESQLADYEAARKSFDSVQRNMITISESLDKVLPPLPKEEVTQMSSEDSNIVIAKGFGSEFNPDGHAFDDDETRAFYEDVPNLSAQLPTILLGTSQPSDAGEEGKPEEKKSEEAAAAKGGNDTEVEPLRMDQQLRLDDLLSQLQKTVNKDAADKLSLEFCYLNLKSVRKRVVRALFTCPRQRLELLPYYSRMAATLTRVHPEVGPSLCKMLEDEFESLMKKNSLNLEETRVRNVRFLGELTKFKLLPFSSTFMAIKVLLDDFSQNSIDALAALLETTGRFLFRTPETSVRMANILDVMMKKKNAKNLDPRQNTLLENAFYASRPSEKGISQEEVPPLHQYIEFLIFLKLSSSSVMQVVRQCRKLPLAEEEVTNFFLKTLLDVRSIKVSCIPSLALLVSGIARYHDYITVDFVDAVLEEIIVGLEQDDYAQHQHRVSFMILLGELNNARLVDASIIFNTLYLVLFYVPNSRKRSDQLSKLFHARLVLVLLNTCGKNLSKKSNVKKFDMFLLYFQQFLLTLNSTPYELSYDIDETFQRLKPKMVRFKSFEEVSSVIVAIRREQPEDIQMFLIKWCNKSISESEIRESVKNENAMDNHSSDDDSDGHSDSEMGEDSDESQSENEAEMDTKEEKLEDEVEELSESSSSVSGSDSEELSSDTEFSESEESEGEEVVSVKQNLDHLKLSQEEEDNLEREFQLMMQESLGTAKLASKSSNVNLPAANRSLINKFNQSSASQEKSEKTDPASTVQFHVMIKKGTKAVVRDIQVPKAATIAQANESQKAAEAQERSEIKRLVLEASEREEVIFPKARPRGRW